MIGVLNQQSSGFESIELRFLVYRIEVLSLQDWGFESSGLSIFFSIYKDMCANISSLYKGYVGYPGYLMFKI